MLCWTPIQYQHIQTEAAHSCAEEHLKQNQRHFTFGPYYSHILWDSVSLRKECIVRCQAKYEVSLSDISNTYKMYAGRSDRAVYGVGLRPLACWNCGFEYLRGHGCLSVVSVVCCQVEVSVTGRSLVQRSRTECGMSVCVMYDWCL